jgi:hypothetical protein
MSIAQPLLKYYVFTLPGTARFFQSLGLPGALATPGVRFALANLFNAPNLQGEYA